MAHVQVVPPMLATARLLGDMQLHRPPELTADAVGRFRSALSGHAATVFDGVMFPELAERNNRPHWKCCCHRCAYLRGQTPEEAAEGMRQYERRAMSEMAALAPRGFTAFMAVHEQRMNDEFVPVPDSPDLWADWPAIE